MNARNPLSIAIAAVALTVQAASGQAAPPARPSAAPANAAMHLNLVLTGSTAQGLQQSDLRLLDNGSERAFQSLQPLAASGATTHVILVIDDVNARLTTVAYERDQLKKYFTGNDGRLPVPFSIAVMTDTRTEIQRTFSQNGIAVNDGLQKYQVGLHEIRRDSQYGGFDRTDIGIRTLQELVQYASTIPGHKIILFVSPGWPLLSGPGVQLSGKQQRSLLATVAQLQDAMLRSNTVLNMVNPFGPAESIAREDYYRAYLKGVKKPTDVDIADLSLQVLAVHSGGTVQQGSSDIAHMVERSIDDLGSSYTLTFQPTPQEGETTYHSLKVETTRPGLTVRSPDEYYSASPSAGDTPPLDATAPAN